MKLPKRVFANATWEARDGDARKGRTAKARRREGDGMIYNIINPSDPYTMEADDEVVACAAGLILGEGRYALRRADDEQQVLPIFIGGGGIDWFVEKAGCSFADFLNAKGGEIGKALKSVRIGSPEARIHVQSVEDHDKRRSSMNDIGRYAWSVGEALIASAEARKGEVTE
jgi:hypothetical protein